MKILLILILILTTNSYAVNEFICEGVKCRKREVVELPSAQTELKISDLKKDLCLINLKNGSVIRLGDVDQKAKSVETFSEEDYVVSRKVLFYDDQTLDLTMKIVSCADTSTQVLANEVDFKKCLNTTIKSARNFYCEKPRKRNAVLD